MTRLTDHAIQLLNARGEALTEGAIQVDENNVAVHENPEAFARKMLSGFVAPEDIDNVLGFIQEATSAVRDNWMLNPSRSSREALMLTTMAQVVLYGTVIGKGLDDE